MPLGHYSIVTVLLEFFGISLFSSQTWQWVVLKPLVELVDGFRDVVEGWVLGGGAVVVYLGHDIQVAELHGLTADHRGDQPQPDQTKRTHQFLISVRMRSSLGDQGFSTMPLLNIICLSRNWRC